MVENTFASTHNWLTEIRETAEEARFAVEESFRNHKLKFPLDDQVGEIATMLTDEGWYAMLSYMREEG